MDEREWLDLLRLSQCEIEDGAASKSLSACMITDVQSSMLRDWYEKDKELCLERFGMQLWQSAWNRALFKRYGFFDFIGGDLRG